MDEGISTDRFRCVEEEGIHRKSDFCVPYNDTISG